jgi:hypothetical protein
MFTSGCVHGFGYGEKAGMPLQGAPTRTRGMTPQASCAAWGLQERFTARVPSGRPLLTDAGGRAMPVDEVIDIALRASRHSRRPAPQTQPIGLASHIRPYTHHTCAGGVARLVAEGLSNKGIAQAIHITRYTVKRHIASAMDRLGAANRAHAAVLATQRRLL